MQAPLPSKDLVASTAAGDRCPAPAQVALHTVWVIVVVVVVEVAAVAEAVLEVVLVVVVVAVVVVEAVVGV